MLKFIAEVANRSVYVSGYYANFLLILFIFLGNATTNAGLTVTVSKDGGFIIIFFYLKISLKKIKCSENSLEAGALVLSD
jgi:hypothetical protein